MSPEDIPVDKLALYQKLIDTNQEIELKGETIPYTAYDGHMFTFLSHLGVLAIRLSPEEIKKFLSKYDAKLMDAHGFVMKDYVSVPESLLVNTFELKKYLDLSLEYVKELNTKGKKPGRRRISKK